MTTEYKEESIVQTMKFNGIPKRFLAANIQEFPFFEYDKNISYYIYGNNGAGKTRLLCAIGRYNSTIKKMNLDWRFISTPKLLSDIRQSYDKERILFNKSMSEAQIIDLYSNIDLLLLDDLGAEKTTDWSLQTLYLILNNRYENELITIISSNHPPEDIFKYIGDRITSRIIGMCRIIEMKGKDRRIR